MSDNVSDIRNKRRAKLYRSEAEFKRASEEQELIHRGRILTCLEVSLRLSQQFEPGTEDTRALDALRYFEIQALITYASHVAPEIHRLVAEVLQNRANEQRSRRPPIYSIAPKLLVGGPEEEAQP